MRKDFVIFDWEVFPHWNCIVYKIHGTNIRKVITSDDADYRSALQEAANLGYLAGFNIKGYDMQMTDFAIAGYTPEELYEHNQLIIEGE